MLLIPACLVRGPLRRSVVCHGSARAFRLVRSGATQLSLLPLTRAVACTDSVRHCKYADPSTLSASLPLWPLPPPSLVCANSFARGTCSSTAICATRAHADAQQSRVVVGTQDSADIAPAGSRCTLSQGGCLLNTGVQLPFRPWVAGNDECEVHRLPLTSTAEVLLFAYGTRRGVSPCPCMSDASWAEQDHPFLPSARAARQTPLPSACSFAFTRRAGGIFPDKERFRSGTRVGTSQACEISLPAFPLHLVLLARAWWSTCLHRRARRAAADCHNTCLSSAVVSYRPRYPPLGPLLPSAARAPTDMPDQLCSPYLFRFGSLKRIWCVCVVHVCVDSAGGTLSANGTR